MVIVILRQSLIRPFLYSAWLTDETGFGYTFQYWRGRYKADLPIVMSPPLHTCALESAGGKKEQYSFPPEHLLLQVQPSQLQFLFLHAGCRARGPLIMGWVLETIVKYVRLVLCNFSML
jgi:hypothetical protein